MIKLSLVKALTLVARRWFQRGPGNTYHTVDIYIDGEPVHASPITYGYDRQYETTAEQWLRANGHLSDLKEAANGTTEPLHWVLQGPGDHFRILSYERRAQERPLMSCTCPGCAKGRADYRRGARMSGTSRQPREGWQTIALVRLRRLGPGVKHSHFIWCWVGWPALTGWGSPQDDT